MANRTSLLAYSVVTQNMIIAHIKDAMVYVGDMMSECPEQIVSATELLETVAEQAIDFINMDIDTEISASMKEAIQLFIADNLRAKVTFTLA